MTNTTGWSPGRGAGLIWTAAFNSSDLISLPSGSAVMSSVADIANGTFYDLFADVAFELNFASTTLAVSAALGLFIYDKFEIDGSNNYYGDNALPSGSQQTYVPGYGFASSFSPTFINVTQTLVTGCFRQVILPPRSFRFVLANNLGVTLGSSTQFCSYMTYDQNLNA